MLKRPCRSYNATGKCHFGEHCKFLHSSVNILPEENSCILQENGALSQAQKTTYVKISSKIFDSDVKSETTKDEGLNTQNQQTVREKTVEGNICYSYAKTRFCRYGNRCRYQHILPREKNKLHRELHSENVTSKIEDGTEKNQVQNEEGKKNVKKTDTVPVTPSRKICKFFKRGFCQYGERCNFYHPLAGETTKQIPAVDTALVSGGADKQEREVEDWTKFSRAPRVINVFRRGDIDSTKLKELRSTEITQLKRRFPSEALKILADTEKNAIFVFTFIPSDPDWPFDVSSFEIQVSFDENYPLQLFSVDVPLEQDLPATVHRYIKVSLEEWVVKKQEECERKDTVELLFRPFLRWMDRNMEKIVTEGLKQLRRELTAREAGLQFISANELRRDQNQQATGDEDCTVHSGDLDTEKDCRRPVAYRKSEHSEEETYTGPDPDTKATKPEEITSDEADDNEEDDSSGSGQETEDDKGHQRPQIDPNTERRGTEMSFRNKWVWYCTTILVEKLRLVVQCERCKNTTDFITPPNRVNSVACSKCNNTQLVVYRPVLSHANCTTFGYLDVEGCVAYDVILQDCHFSMGCVMCGRDFLSKSYVLGRVMEVRCRGCHNVMKFAAEAVKLTPLTFDGVDSTKFSGKVYKVNVHKNRRVVKDPAIQEGKPLPDNGACKHYKKSFRWLRFPCCGKTYPCDTCHDDKEDHPFVFANRMICGFCCKEQAYSSERPCKGCGGALTKVHTTHWEGGKGCRNKVTMSRNDEKKYANIAKTVSKSLQEKKTGKKKTSNPSVKISSNWT